MLCLRILKPIDRLIRNLEKTLEYRLDKLQETKENQKHRIPLLIRGEEIELFDGEFEAIILKIHASNTKIILPLHRDKKDPRGHNISNSR